MFFFDSFLTFFLNLLFYLIKILRFQAYFVNLVRLVGLYLSVYQPLLSVQDPS